MKNLFFELAAFNFVANFRMTLLALSVCVCLHLSNADAHDSINTVDILKQLELFDEYHLEADLDYYQDDKLFSVSRTQEEFQLAGNSCWKFESTSSKVLEFGGKFIRSEAEMLSLSHGTLMVSKSFATDQVPTDSEMRDALEKAIDAKTSTLAVQKSSTELNAAWGLLLSGIGNDVDLRKWLKTDDWKTISNDSNVAVLESNLSNGNGKCRIELDPNANLRMIRCIRTLGPGDVLRGTQLPTQDTRSKTESMSANWNGDSLESLEFVSKRLDASGITHKRTILCKITKLLHGHGSAHFALKTSIPDGTKVVLIATPRIHAEWRDGKIVKVFSSGEVEVLETLKMSRKSSRFFLLICAAISGLAILACLILRGYIPSNRFNAS